MGIRDVIKQREAEKADLLEKIETHQTRIAFLDDFLKEITTASGTGKTAAPKKAAKKPGRKPGRPKADAPKVGAPKAKRGRKRSGMTVREAILKAVAGASDALRAGEIITKAVDLSGGAVASIRTQINALSKAGELKQIAFKGRGFKYAMGSMKAPAPTKATPKKRKPKAAKAPAAK